MAAAGRSRGTFLLPCVSERLDFSKLACRRACPHSHRSEGSVGSSQTTPVVPPAASAASPWLSTPAHVVPADLDPFRADPATRGPGCGPGAPQPEHLHGHRLSLSGRAGAPTVTIRRNGTSHREAVLVEMTLFRNLCDVTGRRHANLVLKRKAPSVPPVNCCDRNVHLCWALMWPQALRHCLVKLKT